MKKPIQYSTAQMTSNTIEGVKLLITAGLRFERRRYGANQFRYGYCRIGNDQGHKNSAAMGHFPRANPSNEAARHPRDRVVYLVRHNPHGFDRICPTARPDQVVGLGNTPLWTRGRCSRCCGVEREAPKCFGSRTLTRFKPMRSTNLAGTARICRV